MPLPALFQGRLRLPLIGAPMFIVSQPDLVLAQCRAGVVGCFPTLNARPLPQLEAWLEQLTAATAAPGVAPFGANLIVHKSNTRLAEDLELVVKYKVPLVITSVGDPTPVVERVHAYGGIVFHDVIGLKHARKAIGAGVDGLILVCAGAGGHAGTLSPFAFIPEVRKIFAGALILSGAISRGNHIKAAQMIGADLAYMGTRFIATAEAHAQDDYKKMIVDSAAADIVYTPYFSGVNANYLRASITANGLNPDEVLGVHSGSQLSLGSADDKGPKAWRDIWSAGQGAGAIDDVPTVAVLVERLKVQYDAG
jgi:nitronate monooxygenase